MQSNAGASGGNAAEGGYKPAANNEKRFLIMKKELYMVTSENCLFFVCSELSAEEIERAYLTELNSHISPKTWYKVTKTDLKEINSIRYGSQPVYSVKKNDGEFLYNGLYMFSAIRRGRRGVVTENDLI